MVAFAAEVEDAVARGRRKMARKGVDAIVVNDVSRVGLGFDSERNAGTMLIGGSGGGDAGDDEAGDGGEGFWTRW